VRNPNGFLFDKPLPYLDAALRVNKRLEMMEMNQDLGATMIYVTHDQVEAMTMVDRVVVLNRDVIQQVGSPLELYDSRDSLDSLVVAGFIGSPKMNLFSVPEAMRHHAVTISIVLNIDFQKLQGNEFRRLANTKNKLTAHLGAGSPACGCRCAWHADDAGERRM
jgi:ABC-type sugar transport system ATPase subunit